MNCVVSNAAMNQATTFPITNTELYAPVVTWSNDDNAKLLQQLKSGFKRTISWNKYETKKTTHNAPNQYFDFLIEPSFQEINKLFD